MDPLSASVASGRCDGCPSGELLDRYAARSDEAAFAEVVRRYDRMVETVCRRMVDDPGDPEGVAQSVFALMAERAGRLSNRDEAGIGAWLSAVAVRMAANQRRALGRRRRREAAEAPISEPAGPPRDDLGEIMDEALAAMPASMRQLIHARFYSELSYQDIGGQLGVSPGAARGRLHRALNELRRRLSGRRPVVVAGSSAAALASTRKTWAAVALAGAAALTVALVVTNRDPVGSSGAATGARGITVEAGAVAPGAPGTHAISRGDVFIAEMRRLGLDERRQRRLVQPETNGFGHLEVIARLYDQLEEDIGNQTGMPLITYLSPNSNALRTGLGTWDHQFAESLLAACEPIRDAFDQLLDSPDFQFPEAGLGDSVWFLSATQMVGVYLQQFEAELALRSGDEARAMQTVFDSLDFADRIEGGDGRVIHALVGGTVRAAATANLMTHLGERRIILADHELAGVVELLDRFAPDPRDFDSAVSNERWAVTELMQAAFAGDPAALAGLGSFASGDDAGSWDAERARSALQRIEPTTLARELTEVWRAREGAEAGTRPELLWPGDADPVGLARWLAERTGGDGIAATKFAHSKAYHQVARAWIGLERARAAGETITALSDLVPRFLPDVPIDPFDGNPIRFDPKQGRIWSVGIDRIDGGGEVRPGREGVMRDPNEIVMDSPKAM